MVNRRLKLLRTQNKLSQQHLASVLGVERSTYCGYETGRRKVNVETLSKLAEFYNLPFESFLEEANDSKVAEESYESNEIMYLSQLTKDEIDLIVCYRLAHKNNKNKITDIVKENFK